jgi:hypothetical protein
MAMWRTNDSYLATNPADQWLGPHPDEDEYEPSCCPICGCEIWPDETPCDLEYGTKCGIALLREGRAA